MFGWPMRAPKMSRDDAQRPTAAITERRGLHRPKSRGGRNRAVRGKAGASFDIFDDNAHLALQGPAPGPSVIAHVTAVIQKLLVKNSLSHHLKISRHHVEPLNQAKI